MKTAIASILIAAPLLAMGLGASAAEPAKKAPAKAAAKPAVKKAPAKKATAAKAAAGAAAVGGAAAVAAAAQQPLPDFMTKESDDEADAGGMTTIEATGSRLNAQQFLDSQPNDKLCLLKHTEKLKPWQS